MKKRVKIDPLIPAENGMQSQLPWFSLQDEQSSPSCEEAQIQLDKLDIVEKKDFKEKKYYKKESKKTVDLPTSASLQELAIWYLGKFSSSEKTLQKVLDNRINKWIQQTGANKDEAERLYGLGKEVVKKLVRLGLINDQTYAESKMRSLARTGKSSRAIVAQLFTKGVEKEVIEEVISENKDNELRAALILARKKRLGPFGAENLEEESNKFGRGLNASQKAYQKTYSALARGRFDSKIIRSVMNMTRQEAEEILESGNSW